jgi:HK97 family phage major capsid protein
MSDRTRTLSFSSESPVERWFGTEILDHTAGAARMDFMASGRAPLLLDHNPGRVVGVIETASIGRDKIGHAAARFGRGSVAVDTLRDVDDGILQNTSVGYRVHGMILEEARDEGDVYRVDDWEPLEASLVGIPADPTVGVGRSRFASGENADTVRVTESAQGLRTTTAREAMIMDETPEQKAARETATAAGVATRAAEQVHGADVDRERVTGIENLCGACNIDAGLQSRWITAGTSLTEVAKQITAIQKQRAEKSKPLTELGLGDKEVRRYSLARAIKACADQNWSDAGFEAEISAAIGQKVGRVSDKMRFFVPHEVQKRDLTVGTASAGGYLVATNNQSFIEILRNSSVAIRMGVMEMPGLVGSITVPKQTAAATNYWLSTEATAITESQQTFAQMALSPKTAGGYVEISRQLLLQSSPGAEQIVQNDLAQVVGLAVDLAVLNGSGASGQPTGIINTAGIGGVTGTSITYTGIVEFQTDTAAGNALFDAAGYVTTPAVAGLLKQRVKFTSTASPIWEGKLLDGTVDGYRAMASNQVPSANILFGDFGKVVLASWGVLEVEVNPYANFAAGIVGVRAMYSIDVGVRYAAAFSLATSVT